MRIRKVWHVALKTVNTGIRGRPRTQPSQQSALNGSSPVNIQVIIKDVFQPLKTAGLSHSGREKLQRKQSSALELCRVKERFIFCFTSSLFLHQKLIYYTVITVFQSFAYVSILFAVVLFFCGSRDSSREGWFVELAQLINPTATLRRLFCIQQKHLPTSWPRHQQHIATTTTQPNLLAVICQVGRVCQSTELFTLPVWFVFLSPRLVLWLATWPSGPVVKSGRTLILPVEIPSVYAGRIHTSTLWFGLNLKIPECETFWFELVWNQTSELLCGSNCWSETSGEVVSVRFRNKPWWGSVGVWKQPHRQANVQRYIVFWLGPKKTNWTTFLVWTRC